MNNRGMWDTKILKVKGLKKSFTFPLGDLVSNRTRNILYYKLMLLYLQTNMPSFLILEKSLKNVICNEKKNFIILTTYNIGRYNIDNNKIK